MTNRQTVVWLDHKKAKIFSLDGTIARTVEATPPGEDEYRPNKATASGRRGDHRHERYYRRVMEALRDTGSLMLCGPATAKLEFSRYLQSHSRDLSRRVLDLETMDHPSDRQLLARARQFFLDREPDEPAPL
jgi:stalled ribosome rescue protein Dom34